VRKVLVKLFEKSFIKNFPDEFTETLKSKMGCRALLGNPKITFASGSHQEIPILLQIPSFFALRRGKT
jgi:hypothetical protein